MPGVASGFRVRVGAAEAWRTDSGWLPGLVTDYGLESLIWQEPYLGGCLLSSNTDVVDASDPYPTEMLGLTESFVEEFSGVRGSTPYYGWLQRRYLFEAGEATGSLAKVGIVFFTDPVEHTEATAAYFSLSALPAVEVSASESVEVVYELRFYPPEADTVSEMVVEHDYEGREEAVMVTVRAAHVTDPLLWAPTGQTVAVGDCFVSDGEIGTEVARPSGVPVVPWDVGTLGVSYGEGIEYVATLKWDVDDTYPEAGVGAAYCEVPGLGAFQLGFSPKFYCDGVFEGVEIRRYLRLPFAFSLTRCGYLTPGVPYP